MKRKVLFIGSFLSRSKGTKGIAENLSESDLASTFRFVLVSRLISQPLRLMHMILASAFYNYTVIHIDVYSGKAFYYADITSMIAKLRGKRIIMNLHGGALPKFAALKGQRVKEVLGRSNYIISPSKYLIDYFANLGIAIRYLPNTVDLKKFAFCRANVKRHSLLWVRAFDSIYNPDVPVKVLKELLVYFPHATLTMIGPDKGRKEDIERLCDQLKVTSRVKFVGPIPNNELYKFYQTHHVFMNTTSFESFGMAVMEAGASGIPIISNPVGELPYIWTRNLNILYADNNDIDSFTEQIFKVFTNAELEERLGNNGRIVAEQYDWEAHKKIWYNILS